MGEIKTFFNKKILKRLVFLPLYFLMIFFVSILPSTIETKDELYLIQARHTARSVIANFQERHIVKIDNKCYLTPNDTVIMSHILDNVHGVYELSKEINRVFVGFNLLAPFLSQDKNIEKFYQEHTNSNYTYRIKKNGIEYLVVDSEIGGSLMFPLIAVYRKNFNLELASASHLESVFKTAPYTHDPMGPISIKQYSEASIDILAGIKPTPCRD